MIFFDNSKNPLVKKFTGDVVLNTIAFGIYIVAQQIVLLPILAKYTGDAVFSKIVIYISVFSIITNSLGNELGITRQVRYEYDQEHSIDANSYNFLLQLIAPIILSISFVVFILFKFELSLVIPLSIIVVLGNARLYTAGYFRLNKTFSKVVIQNLLYSLGLGTGLGFFYLSRIVWLPFFIAELFGLIYAVIKTDYSIFEKGSVKLKNQVRLIIHSFSDLSIMSFLANMMVYFDKLVMYPLLGATSVAVYYAANSMSKAINLIINPLYGVVLSWLGTSSSSKKGVIVSATQKLNIPVVLVSSALSFPITYIAVRLLYAQYFEAALPMLIPICISIGFSVANSFMKGVLLKYYETRKLLGCYLSYFFVFIVFALILSNYYGVMGFVCAGLISRFEQWAVFVWFLRKISSHCVN